MEACAKLIGIDAPHLKSDQVFFNNLNLDVEWFKLGLQPITEKICHRIEFTYKSPAKISFLNATISVKNKLIHCMQFDDICLKFWHIDSGLDIFLTLSARLARTLLIRLLASSLIDESNSLPFSATEKGIFSFIVARLLFDLKNTLVDKMPSVKLTGIYHYHDEAIADADILDFGSYNFSFSFAADIYPITIAIPKKFFKDFTIKTPHHNQMLARAGHLRRPLIFCLRTLRFFRQALISLRTGDLIIFDNEEVKLAEQSLCGVIESRWGDFCLRGEIKAQDGKLIFVLGNTMCSLMEDNYMEELEISSAMDADLHEIEEKKRTEKLADLAKNIRVALSIEVSRLPMTLKEIIQLREGEIIDLHRKIDDHLAMVIENKVIGYCQPVQIDSRLGIRITKLINEPDNEA
jgi:flagellar motor switch protein FliN